MNGLPVRVVKVGGSLFDDPQLPDRLNEWLASQPPAINVLIAGGGELAEFIRRADDMFGIRQVKAHWLSIDLMSVTAQVLVELIDDARIETDFNVLIRTIKDGARVARIVFDARNFLRDREPDCVGSALPHDETVTSDSIAARLAEVIAADELVLLKSADPLPAATADQLAAANYVDACFPQTARRLRSVRFVNLRGSANSSETER